MADSKHNGKVEFSGLYVIPGEGTVVALSDSTETMLFDKQGLQHRILERRAQGENTEGEEHALLRLNQLTHSSSPDRT